MVTLRALTNGLKSLKYLDKCSENVQVFCFSSANAEVALDSKD